MFGRFAFPARVYFILIILSIFGSFIAHAETKSAHSTAFYYGNNLPIGSIASFNRIVVEPENTTEVELAYLKEKGIKVFAYLSIGEVRVDRPWSKKLNKQWILGSNKDWNTLVLDMSSTGWQEFLIHDRAEALWQQGYQGFFLDTMDSYQLFSKIPAASSAQINGIIQLLRKMKKQFPKIRFIFNRGFEILDEVGDLAEGVVAESLFVGWDPQTSRYKNVALDDREWLIKKLTRVRDKYKLPVIVIDYLPRTQHKQAKKVARKIADLGFTPWVAPIELNQMGVGAQNLYW